MDAKTRINILMQLNEALKQRSQTARDKSDMAYSILVLLDAICQSSIGELIETIGEEALWEGSGELFKETESDDTEAFCDYVQAILVNREDEEGGELVALAPDGVPIYEESPSMAGVKIEDDSDWESYVPPLPDDAEFNGKEPDR